jgi:hypothetical protein
MLILDANESGVGSCCNEDPEDDDSVATDVIPADNVLLSRLLDDGFDGMLDNDVGGVVDRLCTSATENDSDSRLVFPPLLLVSLPTDMFPSSLSLSNSSVNCGESAREDLIRLRMLA